MLPVEPGQHDADPVKAPGVLAAAGALGDRGQLGERDRRGAPPLRQGDEDIVRAGVLADGGAQ